MPTLEGGAAWSPDGRYKYGGEISGYFRYAVNLCRFEPDELDDWVPGLRMAADEKSIDLDKKT
jgi:hypothetical protein